jgi:riboflavin biosynthesis pyrimidine reductase
MLFQRAIPPGPAASPETIYSELGLAERARADRPYVVCNFVSSADGKAAAQGRTALLGGDGDREVFHLLRTQAEAILAGTGTLRVERYGALVRDDKMARIRVDQGRAAQPMAVVISRSGLIPFDIPLFDDPGSRIAVYAPADTAVPDVSAAVTLHELPGAEDELPGVLRSLRHEHGIRSLLCEGGPALFSELLARGVVDELFLTLAPALVGGGQLGITTGTELEAPLGMELIWALERDGHLFLRYALH